ncbi:hypothetical protein Poli38472_009767 [Pythium oligandrum]|uniref:Chorein N-terminal domain-containing protein n=1 Tax=Pythium oligandrum TaxID=41045 RepID=A0A8K1CF18_PYTOL|nr:hypothetical protein Poli38472_009767 [Pythium oligandrum]|eukprot:TMW62274.1 hypothetical protein Poli38472_009767 [Pythium oligandrum]
MLDILSSPLRGYIAQNLQFYLSKYIEGIQLEGLGLFGGDLVLNDLEIKRHVLAESLEIPSSFDFSRGFIRELRIHIPWTQLLSQPIEVKLYTVELILTARDPSRRHSVDSAMAARHSARTRSIESASSKEASEIENPKSGWLRDTLQKILANVTIQVNNLVMKYEQDDVVLSVALGVLDCYSVSETRGWVRSFVDPQGSTRAISRVIEAKDLTIFLDRYTSDRSQSDPSASEIRRRVVGYEVPVLSRTSLSIRGRIQLKPKSDKDDEPKMPLSATDSTASYEPSNYCDPFFSYSCSRNNVIPMLEVDAFIGELSFSLSDRQLQMISEMTRRPSTVVYDEELDEANYQTVPVVASPSESAPENPEPMGKQKQSWFGWAMKTLGGPENGDEDELESELLAATKRALQRQQPVKSPALVDGSVVDKPLSWFVSCFRVCISSTSLTLRKHEEEKADDLGEDTTQAQEEEYVPVANLGLVRVSVKAKKSRVSRPAVPVFVLTLAYSAMECITVRGEKEWTDIVCEVESVEFLRVGMVEEKPPLIRWGFQDLSDFSDCVGHPYFAASFFVEMTCQVTKVDVFLTRLSLNHVTKIGSYRVAEGTSSGSKTNAKRATSAKQVWNVRCGIQLDRFATTLQVPWDIPNRSKQNIGDFKGTGGFGDLVSLWFDAEEKEEEVKYHRVLEVTSAPRFLQLKEALVSDKWEMRWRSPLSGEKHQQIRLHVSALLAASIRIRSLLDTSAFQRLSVQCSVPRVGVAVAFAEDSKTSYDVLSAELKESTLAVTSYAGNGETRALVQSSLQVYLENMVQLLTVSIIPRLDIHANVRTSRDSSEISLVLGNADVFLSQTAILVLYSIPDILSQRRSLLAHGGGDLSKVRIEFVNSSGRDVWYRQEGTAECLLLERGKKDAYSWLTLDRPAYNRVQFALSTGTDSSPALTDLSWCDPCRIQENCVTGRYFKDHGFMWIAVETIGMKTVVSLRGGVSISNFTDVDIDLEVTTKNQPSLLLSVSPCQKTPNGLTKKLASDQNAVGLMLDQLEDSKILLSPSKNLTLDISGLPQEFDLAPSDGTVADQTRRRLISFESSQGQRHVWAEAVRVESRLAILPTDFDNEQPRFGVRYTWVQVNFHPAICIQNLVDDSLRVELSTQDGDSYCCVVQPNELHFSSEINAAQVRALIISSNNTGVQETELADLGSRRRYHTEDFVIDVDPVGVKPYTSLTIRRPLCVINNSQSVIFVTTRKSSQDENKDQIKLSGGSETTVAHTVEEKNAMILVALGAPESSSEEDGIAWSPEFTLSWESSTQCCCVVHKSVPASREGLPFVVKLIRENGEAKIIISPLVILHNETGYQLKYASTDGGDAFIGPNYDTAKIDHDRSLDVTVCFPVPTRRRKISIGGLTSWLSSTITLSAFSTRAECIGANHYMEYDWSLQTQPSRSTNKNVEASPAKLESWLDSSAVERYIGAPSSDQSATRFQIGHPDFGWSNLLWQVPGIQFARFSNEVDSGSPVFLVATIYRAGSWQISVTCLDEPGSIQTWDPSIIPSYFQNVEVKIAPAVVQIEDELIVHVQVFMRPVLDGIAGLVATRIRAMPPRKSMPVLWMESLREKLRITSQQRVFIDRLDISTIELTITARISLPVLSSFDGTPLRFGQRSIRQVFTFSDQLYKDLAAEYVADVIVRSPMLLMSLNIFGNPAGFFRHVGTGMRDLFEIPFAAASRDGFNPWILTKGVFGGIASLIGHTSAAALSSIAGFSYSISRTVDHITLTPEQLRKKHYVRPAHLTTAIAGGLGSLGSSVVGAATGIVSTPLAMYQEKREQGLRAGVSGVVGGLGMGLVGIVARPMGGVAALVAMASDGILYGTGFGGIDAMDESDREAMFDARPNELLRFKLKVLRDPSVGELIVAHGVWMNPDVSLLLPGIDQEELQTLSEEEKSDERVSELFTTQAWRDQSAVVIIVAAMRDTVFVIALFKEHLRHVIVSKTSLAHFQAIEESLTEPSRLDLGVQHNEHVHWYNFRLFTSQRRELSRQLRQWMLEGTE